MTKEEKAAADKPQFDILLEEAARIIIKNQNGSAAFIQRRLAVGFMRIGRIMDQLEKVGVVGPFTGTKPRLVLIKSEAELEDLVRMGWVKIKEVI